jgi:hypothetical protein
MTIDQFETCSRGHYCGIVAAGEGEFLLPDTFGKLAAVPLTPTIGLFCDSDNMELSMPEVAKVKPASGAIGPRLLYCTRFHYVSGVIMWRAPASRTSAGDCGEDSVSVERTNLHPRQFRLSYTHCLP